MPCARTRDGAAIAAVVGAGLALAIHPRRARAAALAREGKLREALSLLYRGALSNMVHKRGVQLLPSHTEAEVLSLSGRELHFYLEKLIDAWRLCAYAKRNPAPADIERLAQGYQASFA